MSDDVLSTIAAIAGDNNGGPHIKVEVDSRSAVDDLTDEQVADVRKAAEDTFRHAFHQDAEQVVVMVQDA